MTMSYHVNAVVKSAFYHLRNIAEIRRYSSSETTKILVCALVISRIDICNCLLCGLLKNLIGNLQNVQSAAGHIILKLGKYEYISSALHELHWLPGEQRIIYKIDLLTYKCLHN